MVGLWVITSVGDWQLEIGRLQPIIASFRPSQRTKSSVNYPKTWTTTVSQKAVVTTAQAVAMVIWFDANA
jgi:hypothetical protein